MLRKAIVVILITFFLQGSSLSLAIAQEQPEMLPLYKNKLALSMRSKARLQLSSTKTSRRKKNQSDSKMAAPKRGLVRVSRSISRSQRINYNWLPGRNLTSGQTQGMASYYRYKGGMTAAALVAPKGTIVRVTNLETGGTVNVVINDRGPFVPGRVIDLDRDAFVALFGSTRRGVGPVKLEW